MEEGVKNFKQTQAQKKISESIWNIIRKMNEEQQ